MGVIVILMLAIGGVLVHELTANAKIEHCLI
jgi:hypothetical protein